MLAVQGLFTAQVDAQSAASGSPTITINIFNERHLISPYVYGGSFPKDSGFVRSTGTRLCRWGGNSSTSYNWKLRLQNTAADWYFENFNGVSIIDWVKWIDASGSAAMVAIPMVDWTPKAAGEYSFSVKKYGPQQKTDPYLPDAGNGMLLGGKPVQNDPNDAYVPLLDRPSPADPPGSVYRSELIETLKGAFGPYPHIYEFDNEPEIWDSTHQDIHPQPVTYNEMRDKFLDMSQLVRSIDPRARIAGPVVCAWWFYWNSSAGASDKQAHGGVDYLPWWLGAVADADRSTGKRSLDIFDIHAYPDFNSKGSQSDVDGSRIRSPRGMWDPDFRSEGSIGTDQWATSTQPYRNSTATIPRFRAMVNALYPGTRFAISEWDYGSDDNNVAASLADADTYGILGREKADLSTRWTSPQPNSLCNLALTMYRRFAPLSVEDRIENVSVDLLTSYAALSPDGHQLTVMTINKDPLNSTTEAIALVGFHPVSVVAYSRDGNNSSVTETPSTAPPSAYTFKPYSQTLLVLQGSTTMGVLDWSIDKDSLQMLVGSHTELSVSTNDAHKTLTILSIKAPTGVAMSVHRSSISAGHPGVIDVATGSDPGFYRYRVTVKTAAGLLETQSGWIVVGDVGSLPPTQSN
jgi:hypothetical protein